MAGVLPGKSDLEAFPTPKWSPKAVWTPLGAVLGPFWKHFGTIFGQFLDNFGQNLDEVLCALVRTTKLELFSALFILSRKFILFITLRNESKFIVVVVVESVFVEYLSLPGTKNFAPGAMEFLSTGTVLGFLFG